MKTFRVKVFLIACAAIVVAMLVFASHTSQSSLKDSVIAKPLNIDQFSSDIFTSLGSPTIDKAYKFCQKRKFAKAQQLLSDAGTSIQNQPTAQFIQAICYLQKEELKKAEQLLQELKQNGYPFVQDQVNWCLAVLNLKQNKINDAQPYLEILAGQPNADHHVEACTLIKELGLVSKIAFL